MKNIVYIHQYFITPEEGGAIRSYHIAKGMVNRGHHVDMITSYNGKGYKKVDIDGIEVHYLPVAYYNKFTFFRRLFSFMKFVYRSINLSRKLSSPDLVYATSTPLTVGLVALWMKWSKNIPYLFEVRDLWPEAPVQLGIIRSGLLKRVLKTLEKKIYQSATLIIALSPGIKKGVLNAWRHSEVAVIPNMADVDFFAENSGNMLADRPFKIGYFGAFGLANNTSFILQLARECKKKQLDIDIVLAGKGSEKKHVERIAKKHQLDNIKFTGHVNQAKIRDLMTEVDACITSFLNAPILQTNSPNKFFDGLAAAKLMIVNTPGWLQDLVEHHQCGFYIDPEKPEEFPSLILPYLKDPELLHASQQNALKLAKDQFLKENLVGELCDLLAKI